jgi:hypothetical protein
MEIRELMQSHPLQEHDNPPRWSPQIEVGKNTALLKIEGPLVYATHTTAAWLWDNLSSGAFWHEMTIERGHKVAFLADRLPSVVRTLRMAGKQVLIV